MTLIDDSTKAHMFHSMKKGLERDFILTLLTHPLNVIKFRQQFTNEPKKCYKIAFEVFQNEGIGAFYKGLKPQLLKTVLRIWTWPMMTGIPSILEPYIKDPYRGLGAGIFISTIEKAITTPLQKAIINSSVDGKNTTLLDMINKKSWNGFFTDWAASSVKWASFLVSQKYLRERYGKENLPLTVPQLVSIGIMTALFVSVISAPFDMANTIRMTNNTSITQLLSKNALKKSFKGLPISFVTLCIQSMASVSVLHDLENKLK